MRYLLIILILISFNSAADYFDYSHKWATSDNYRIQTKLNVKNELFFDLDIENSFYNQKSDIRIDIRRIGASYIFDLKPLSIFVGVNYTVQSSFDHDKFSWKELHVSAHYKVENYPLLVDFKYTVPYSPVESDVNPESKVNKFSLGIGYEIYNDFFIRIEKHEGSDYYIGFRKWI